MPKDKRYKVIKIMIENGTITSFPGIFEYIPKTVVAKSLGANPERMDDLIEHGQKFRFEDVDRLAELCDVDIRVFFNLAIEHYIQHRKLLRKGK